MRCTAKLFQYILVAMDKLVFYYKCCLVVLLRYIGYNALLITTRLGFKTCLSKTKTKTKTQQFQDQDRDSRLTRPILAVHDWDEL